MLNAKWKGGETALKTATEAPRAGQIRKFRIAALDSEKKTIIVDLIV
jgi:hypothetical protein